MTDANVQCINCAKFSVQRASAENQRNGFGCCDLHEPWILYGPKKDRDCGQFSKAEPGVIAKREQWLRNLERGTD